MQAKIDRNRVLVPLLSLVAIALFAGCSENPLDLERGGVDQEVRLQTTWIVVVEPAIADLVAGESLQLRAYLRHAGGGPLHPAEVEWISEDPQAAMVTEDGLVEGNAAGLVTIRAILADFNMPGEIGSRSAEARIEVRSGAGTKELPRVDAPRATGAVK